MLNGSTSSIPPSRVLVWQKSPLRNSTHLCFFGYCVSLLSKLQKPCNSCLLVRNHLTRVLFAGSLYFWESQLQRGSNEGCNTLGLSIHNRPNIFSLSRRCLRKSAPWIHD